MPGGGGVDIAGGVGLVSALHTPDRGWAIGQTQETPMSLFAILLILVALVVGVVVGAYSHKWLAKVTAAPSNLTAASATTAAEHLLTHAKGSALAAIDYTAEAVKANILKA